MKKLEVGDMVYAQGRYGLSRSKITRVTDKRAFSLVRNVEHAYHREYKDDGQVTPYPDTFGYDSPTYRIETPALKAEYYLACLRNAVKRIEWDLQPKEVLEAVYDSVSIGPSPGALKKRPMVPQVGDLVVNRGASGVPCLFLWGETDDVAMKDDLPTIVIVQTADQLRALAGKDVTI